MKKDVTVLIGSGAIGLSIAKKVSANKHILLADLNLKGAKEAASVLLSAGHDVSVFQVDVSSKESAIDLSNHAAKLGHVKHLIHSAGVPPSTSTPETILKVDLYGTALILEQFRNVISKGGAGIVVSSHASHRLHELSHKQNEELAITPAEKLLSLPLLHPEEIKDSLHAYQLAKRGCTLRVMAEAVHWGKRGARLNTISPGITQSPLAKNELSGPNGDKYKKMIESCPAGRAGTTIEVSELAAFLMGQQGSYISGSDFLIDGGVTAAYWFGETKG